MPASKVDPYAAKEMYENGAKVSEIAKRFGVSRIAIWKRWQKIGFSTEGFRVERECALCGKTVQRHRSRAHKTQHNYCSKACYMEFIKASGEGYMQYRQGSRRARAEVSRYFQLAPGMIVHHVDKDSRHNHISNLWVFTSQAEHMCHHRGGLAEPVFRGDLLGVSVPA